MRTPFPHSLALGGLKAITGLGALSVQQTFDIARSVGFPPDVARRMVAVAQRESNLNPSAACINCLKRSDGSTIRESSIGLWQINTNDPSVWSLVRRATGISNPEQLKDPLINAKAAYALYGGSENNLQIAWRINSDSADFPYATAYRSFLNKLPSTEDLERGLSNPSIASSGASGGSYIPTGGNSLPVHLADPQDVTLFDESADSIPTIALLAGAALLLYALS